MTPLSRREAFGAAVGLLALAEALGAALLAPGIPPVVRGLRVAIDVVLAAGFVAYLRGEHTPPPKRGRFRRWLAIALIVAGGVFALVAPGVDPWRRAFRAALAFSLAVAIALGVGRAVPPSWHRARVLLVVFTIVELIVALAATLEIDIPIALAGLAPVGRAMAARLEDGGYALPPALGGIAVRAAPRAFTVREGRLVGTDELADTLHFLNEDPVTALARLFDEPHGFSAWRNPGADACVLVRAVRPPLDGYRDAGYAEAVAATVAACAAARETVRR